MLTQRAPMAALLICARVLTLVASQATRNARRAGGCCNALDKIWHTPRRVRTIPQTLLTPTVPQSVLRIATHRVSTARHGAIVPSQHLREDRSSKRLGIRTVPQIHSSLVAGAEKAIDDRGSIGMDGGQQVKKKSLSKRIVTGWLLAFAGTAVIFSGNILYTMVLAFVAMIAQHEYFNTVMMTGVKPARRISFVASIAMYVCACKFPMQHQLGLPLGFAAVVMWFLVMRPKPGTNADISTTLTGLVYTGLMPSYWARLRCMETVPGVSEAVTTSLDCGIRWLSPLPLASDIVTQGALTYWFAALGCALADVGAYFGGKTWGRRKISDVCPAAGGASPNKTVEGFLSGAVMAMTTALIGARVMGWPQWIFTGIMYGIMISFISLVGDLMASMIKRDAGVKDFGTIFPGHGGILDRLDSYIFVGPSVYAFVTLFLPFVERLGVATSAAGVAGVFTTVATMCIISRRDFWKDVNIFSMGDMSNMSISSNVTNTYVGPTAYDGEDEGRL